MALPPVRVAHLVRVDGVLDAARVAETAQAWRALVSASHDTWCAAVQVDLSGVTRVSADLVPMLRRLYRESQAHHLAMTVVAPRGSAVRRLLDFHEGLGEHLPPTTETLALT